MAVPKFINISYSLVDSSADGVSVEAGVAVPKFLDITHSAISAADKAVHVYGATTATITDNNLVGGAYGVFGDDVVGDVTVQGNTILTDGTGAQVTGITGSVTLTGNHFEHGGGGGGGGGVVAAATRSAFTLLMPEVV